MWNKQSNHFNRSIITHTMLLLIVMTGSVSAQRTAVSDKPDTPFVFVVNNLAIKAPTKYPWNLLAAAVNYQTHAAEMGGAHKEDIEAEDPIFFAKSPRSCIIDSGEPFYITPGRNIDSEGETRANQ